MEKKLYRDESRKVIAGVCAGLADYFSIDVTLVRLLFVLTLIYHGGGTLAYIVLWIVMPRRNVVLNEPVVDYTVHGENPPSQPFRPSFKSNNNKDIAQIGGAVLILLGIFFLLDQFDFIPYWFNFEQFWPVILVVIGLGLILRSKNKTVEPKTEEKKEDWSGINPNDNNTKDI
ncbi:PspC domain-containing protein [Mucilaginibacter arboris]|uniref:PspC domain-containing protein n=1 Tax=Mucilaginibacter arboris TaxID=2682090 RepID=A0A7K1SUG7_9SPHI|nr:PspC domain-containing protein [Mucilaginibacter arboris]MVN20966.1 PspC domain-containing protein [Mucilaginibacter arboris]